MVADWSLVLRDSGLVLLILHRHHDCHTCNIYIVTHVILTSHGYWSDVLYWLEAKN